MSPEAPRLGPVSAEDLSDEQRELLAGIGGVAGDSGAANIFATLVRHPGLFRRWLPFGGKLLAGKLPARDRELLILRTAFNCRSSYEWAQHARIARGAGISREEIERVPADLSQWEGFDATLLRAADELHRSARLTDTTWAELAEVYDERQLIEVPMVVGHYHLVAFTLNSLGVEVEPGTDPAGAGAWPAGDTSPTG